MARNRAAGFEINRRGVAFADNQRRALTGEIWRADRDLRAAPRRHARQSPASLRIGDGDFVFDRNERAHQFVADFGFFERRSHGSQRDFRARNRLLILIEHNAAPVAHCLQLDRGLALPNRLKLRCQTGRLRAHIQKRLLPGGPFVIEIAVPIPREHTSHAGALDELGLWIEKSFRLERTQIGVGQRFVIGANDRDRNRNGPGGQGGADERAKQSGGEFHGVNSRD